MKNLHLALWAISLMAISACGEPNDLDRDNLNGPVKRLTSWSESENDYEVNERKFISEYDEDGMFSGSYTLLNDEIISERSEIERKDGKVIEVSTRDSLDNIVSREEYEYEEDREYRKYFVDGELNYTSTRYMEDGKLIKEKSKYYDGDEVIGRTTNIYEYDDEGALSGYTSKGFGSGRKEHTCTYISHDDKGNWTACEWRGDVDSEYVVTVYREFEYYD